MSKSKKKVKKKKLHGKIRQLLQEDWNDCSQINHI